ncbi:integrator complex subunit 7-like [Artemia franciscana]|uniref:Integrator complex subunit 7 n=1 Tax=Artemia franciscana TaxID=6661 RepID=A0AA88I267_ARTSF|nr:hypothetical protein QYM36_003707 [Artemia franciscana]
MIPTKHGHPDISMTSDTELDFNSALAELDKGLRSMKPGEQCEAIVKFPALFEKYPFPILVNASFLKLAEVFRNGTNFLRLWILRVCQQSENHIKKVQNVDEFVKRTFSVIHSNDPVARSLTLRLLASLAPVVPEHVGVHHSVRTALDSFDAIELQAAITAAEAFASKSEVFAIQLFDKIAEKIQSLSCPVETKIQLLPILKHMGSDAPTAARVRHICEELLEQNFPQALNVQTLDILTTFAEQTTAQVEDQVNLLLRRLRTDPNRVVRIHCLKNLKKLAKKGYLWNKEQTNNLLEITPGELNQIEEALVLEVLAELVTNEGVNSLDLLPDSPVHVLWKTYISANNLKVASAALRLLSHLAARSPVEADSFDLILETNRALESLLLSPTCMEQAEVPIGRTLMTKTLSAAVELGRINKDVCTLLAETLGNRLVDLQLGYTLSSVCEALSFLGDKYQLSLLPILSKVNLCISRFICDVVEEEEKSRLKEQIMVRLCVLLCLAHHGYSWQAESLSTLRLAALHGNYWSTYRIARACARYDHAQVGLEIMAPLDKILSSESRAAYIQGCTELLRSKSMLLSQEGALSEKISAAADCCERAASHLKLVSEQGLITSFIFHEEYLKTRAYFLIACGQLVATLKTLRTAPPPAPAVALGAGGTYKDDLLKCGRAATQLKNSVGDFRRVAAQYESLYESSFDADADTLSQILINQHYCLMFARGIERTALRRPQQGLFSEEELAFEFSPDLPKSLSQCCLEVRKAYDTGVKVGDILRNLANRPDLLPVSHVHVDGIMSALQLVLLSPFCIPRFFFQALQSTTVKLAVSPSSRLGNEPVSIPYGTLFAMTVEGVIQSKGIKRCRMIKMVKINVTNQPPLAKGENKAFDDSKHLSQLVRADHDYFSSEFILNLASPGVHHLTIETALIDENDNAWKTGPSFSLNVRSQDDPTKTHVRQSSTPGSSRT